MNDKLKPALTGGAALGVLSVIPFVNSVNACCCLWAILGGMVATYLYVKDSPRPASPGDGAIIGALAGVVGAVIYVVIGIPIALVMGPTMRNVMLFLVERLDPRQAEMIRQQLEATGTAIGPVIISALIGGVLLTVFSVIGGLIGVPVFEKRKGGSAPPPPPINMGGGPGGYAT